MSSSRAYRLPLTVGDLTLRRVRRADAADLLAYRSDPAVARQQDREPFDAGRVATLIEEQSYVEPGMFGVGLIFAVEFAGKVVGDVPLTVNVPEHRQGEVGFNFHPQYTGRGLATRAVAAVLGFGFVQLGLHRITAATFTDNERAWRLMERVGMSPGGPFCPRRVHPRPVGGRVRLRDAGGRVAGPAPGTGRGRGR